MAGRITKSESQLKPDPRYGDKVLAKFINCVMVDGKKATARQPTTHWMTFRHGSTRKSRGVPTEAIEAFHKAIENAKPNVEVRSKPVGGANIGPDARDPASPAESGFPLDHPAARGERQAAQASRRGAVRRSPRRRQGGHHPGADPPHGGSQQGLQPLLW